MLTMPGVQWRFERKLLGAREVGWLRNRAPWRTYFTSFENDRAIYFAAITQMPGLHNSELKLIKPCSYAERGVKTRYASLFLANIDDLMAQNCWDVDAAWLDYTAPLTVERLALIKKFYDKRVRHILIVTSLKQRFNETTTRAVKKAGGHSQWLREHLAGEVLHDIEYFNTSSMAQFAVRKG
jgi:hypothetical protein